MSIECHDERVVARQREARAQLASQQRRDGLRDRREEDDSASWLMFDEEPIGTRFEVLRRSAIFNLADLSRLRSQRRAAYKYSDRTSESQAIINVDSLTIEDAQYEVTWDCLRRDLRLMLVVLGKIQEAEWSYRSFPYVPNCLLYVCGFGWAQDLARHANETRAILAKDAKRTALSPEFAGQPVEFYNSRPKPRVSEIVWRTTENATEASSGINFLRVVLLFGLGVSGVWSVYRLWRFGTILLCRQSSKTLTAKVGRNDLSEEDYISLKGFKWSSLWWINAML
ncbi:uncharacterized protein LY89DRAFT_724104 [Mollisia scopiformis]|uniref:Uncharacterized protein n=1 Tax=Mollisia scopiformis TaxID=149040 RepID=A0A132BB81_MOLSC|nr:uncharacterized protein LY89DRAFT_724104 [Mollisia scopiformis]KUJ09680.1 hypothetical protein LY89DRAFT_724104 [Mollisia scopiformis]